MSLRILKRPEVELRTSLSRSRIYQLIQLKQFPIQIQLSSGGRAVGWLESDIEAWIEQRIAETKHINSQKGEK